MAEDGDQLIVAVENWLNDNYSSHPGFEEAEPEGRPGNFIVGRLIKALQIELGIENPVTSFGPATEQAFRNLSQERFGSEESHNLVYILQGAFWAKGYDVGSFDGIFTNETVQTVRRFQEHVGFFPDETDGIVDVMLMKALLNTDGFVLAPNGNTNIQNVQQKLNTEYAEGYFDYIPTNGVYERQTNRALIYALQREIGLSDVANGTYGPSTIENTPTLEPGTNLTGVTTVLQMGLAVNEMNITVYDGDYNTTVETAVREFQEFMTLPATGIADMPTIKQVLTSNGYVGRPAIASDASMIINEATANTLVENGYEVIGRYLTGTVGGERSKAMTHEELSILEENNIRVFPIYQDGGWYAEYFNEDQGVVDAREAIEAAYRLGFPEGATIYFAVDFDAYGFQVTDLIVPYMAAVRDVFNENDSSENFPSYQLGVYGPRNVCIRCAEEPGIRAEYSFVANMSTGFSGNLGFTMPENWSFGQFYETSIGSGEGYLEIDKNDYSGLDTGVSSFNPPTINERDSEQEAVFQEWNQIVNQLGVLRLDPFLVSVGFNFNQTYTVFNSGIFRIDVNTAIGYTPPSNDDTIRIDVLNGEMQGSLGSILDTGQSVLTSVGLRDAENELMALSASIDNGYIEFGSEVVGGEIRLFMDLFRDEIETPEGTTTLAARVTFVINLNVPGINVADSQRVMEVVALSGAVLAIVGIFFVAPTVSAGIGVTASLAALIATINEFFDI